MKPIIRWFVAVVSAVSVGAAAAKEPSADPLHALLFPPEVLMQHREQLGLTDEQVRQIRADVEKAGPTAERHEAQLKTSLGELAELLSADEVDEAAALEKLDRVLAAEKQLKHLHLQLLIQIRNELTDDQRRAAADLRQIAVSGKEIEQRLRAKISRIEKEVQSRAQAGRPPFDVVGMMQKFPELMDDGRVTEAEALLNQVSEMLELDEGKPLPAPSTPAIVEKIQRMKEGVRKMQQSGADMSRIQELLQEIGPLMDQNKHAEAEPLVDRVLELLNL